MTPVWSIAPFDPASAEQRGIWRALVVAGGGSVVQMPELVFCCARAVADRNLRFALASREGVPVAAAIVSARRRIFPEVFVVPQMPLGAWVQLPDENLCELARALLAKLAFAARLGISQLDARTVPRPIGENALWTLDHIETSWLEVRGSFDEYWNSLSRNFRGDLRRQREKLAAKALPVRMQVLDAPCDLERAVDDYARIESTGWKAQQGTALSRGHPQLGLYKEILGEFAALGQARVYQYYFGDRMVAAEMYLVKDREMVLLKTTYDESVAPFSPGSLLRQEILASVFSSGEVDRFEFFGPLRQWQLRLNSSVRSIYHANVYRNEFVRRAEFALRTRMEMFVGGSPSSLERNSNAG